MTLKELADLGAVAARFELHKQGVVPLLYISSGDTKDEPARQAFAQAVRDAVKAWLKASGLDDVRNNPDDCTDDELRQVLGMRSQLEAMKGGAK